VSRRRATARLALATALLAAGWGAILLTRGGFDTELFGVRIRTTDPARPLVLAFVATLLFIASVGNDDADETMSWLIGSVERFFASVSDWRVAALLAAGVVALGVVFGAKVAGGSDSYGYVSQAELWLSGHLEIAQTWVEQVPWPGSQETFSPLGYQPGHTPGTITPTYSAGLPMIMALAKRAAGQCAIFWVVPLSGAAMVLATFGIGKRLAGAGTGLAAAWLLATSPPFLFMLMAPMSDLPAAAAWTVSVWCAMGGTLGAAVAGGAAVAVAILIRPNLAPMAIFPALCLLFETRSSGPAHRRSFVQLSGFLLALLPGIVITALLNQRWNGSPFRSGYGTAADIFSVSADNMLQNARNYAIWLSQTHTPLAFVGIAALVAPVRWLWPAHTPRSTVIVLGLFVAGVWAEYCAYHTFGAWWDLRFLLPSFGFMAIGMASVLVRLAGPRSATAGHRTFRRLAAFSVAGAVVLLGLRDIRFAIRGGAFEQQRGETKYPTAGAIVAARTDPNAVIFSAQHSGSIRYYAGRVTLTYFNLDPTWFDRASAWLDAHGAHPYALLEDWEIADFRKHFSPANGVPHLEMAPLVFYNGPSRFYLFDLRPPPGLAPRMETVRDPSPAIRCVGPAPPPALVTK